MDVAQAAGNPRDGALYRTIWRWHFYAGLLVMPLVIVLSLSGALYLFKPQVERWEERAFQGLPTTGAAAPSAQVAAALASEPGSKLVFYRLPEQASDAAMVHLALAGGTMRDVFVGPKGRVLGALDPATRIIAIDRNLHGQLLLGRQGSWLVELAASWAIVMIVSGLYLWWPRGGGLAGVVWPRIGLRGRAFWRELHAVTGFWVSGLALVMLFTGLPWADAWGSAFKAVRGDLSWTKGAQDWTIGGRTAAPELHAEHDHAAMMATMPGMSDMPAPRYDPAMFDRMVASAAAAKLAFPAMVVPPGAPAGEGGSGKPATGWVIKSETQDRPLRATLRYDAQSGALVSRDDFAGKHPIDRVIGYAVAWHEGQLVPGINQVAGLFTALSLLMVSVSGLTMWLRRRPRGSLGAPVSASPPAWPRGWAFWLIAAFLLVWLPLFTASLAVVTLIDRLVVLSRKRIVA